MLWKARHFLWRIKSGFKKITGFRPAPNVMILMIAISFVTTCLIFLALSVKWLSKDFEGIEVSYSQFSEMVENKEVAEEPTVVTKTLLIATQEVVVFERVYGEGEFWTVAPTRTTVTPFDLLMYYELSPSQVVIFPWNYFFFFMGAAAIQIYMFTIFIWIIWKERSRIYGGITKPTAKKISGPKTTFDDVAGADEAVEEMKEPVDYLKDPSKYRHYGAKIPRGVLLYGPPGTGKTLLARAFINEAGIPDYFMSGSEFHEMFVGVGAARARDVVEKAKKNAPSIIAIDELDSAAPRRSQMGPHESKERASLVNQLLSLMDSVEKEDIMVFFIGITNLPESLDPALLRPGRLDRHIEMPYPTKEGRGAILQVHFNRPKEKPIDPDIDIEQILRETEGFNGADLANLVNEAAIRAVRDKKRVEKIIILEDFQASIDRVLMGPEKKLKISPDEREIIARHEAGHAVAATILPDVDPVHMVSILPRGRFFGYTRFLPEFERHIVSNQRILNQIKVSLAGRAAEELYTDKISTGAVGDFKKATSLARNFVCVYGMSDLGPVYLGDLEESLWSPLSWSEDTRKEADRAIRQTLQKSLEETKEELGLEKNKEKLDILYKTLLEKNRITGEQMKKLIG